MRLFHKFLAVLLVAALGPLALAGIGLLPRMERSLRRTSLDVQRGEALRTAESAAAYLENVRSLLALVRKTPGFWNRDRLGGRDAFRAVLDNFPAFEDLAVFTADGEIRYRLRRFEGGTSSLTLREDVRRRLKVDPFYMGEVERDEKGLPRLNVFMSLQDENDRELGFLAGRLNLLDLGARLKGMDAVTGGRAHLLDSRGVQIVPFPDKTPPPPEVLKADWREGEYQDAAGRRVLGVKVPVPGRDWSMVFEQPVSTAFREAARARRWILAVLLVAGTLSLVLCAALTGALVRRLALLRKAVEEMREGRFRSEVPSGTKDEIGALAREIREAQRALERKVRQATIGVMAQRIGHDLREPFVNVRNSLDLVRGHAQGMDAVALKHLGLIRREIDRGLDGAEDLLSLGRERPPALRLERINNLVEEWCGSLHPPEGLSLVWKPFPDLPPCSVDARELARAFFNAARNALEAAGPGGKVEISTRHANGTVWISVADNGPGVPPELKERTFEDFFTTKPQGTGLGLGIIRQVMERHGGRARLSDRPGGGAVLEMGLPLPSERIV